MDEGLSDHIEGAAQAAQAAGGAEGMMGFLGAKPMALVLLLVALVVVYYFWTKAKAPPTATYRSMLAQRRALAV